MGKSESGGPDPHEKSLEAYNDVFADIMNAVLFKGRPEVSETELEDAKTNSKYWVDGTKATCGSAGGRAERAEAFCERLRGTRN